MQFNCTIAQLGPAGEVTFEVSYETHTRRPAKPTVATTVGELKLRLERLGNRFPQRDYETASWRILKTTMLPESFLGARAVRACARGCAFHEARSIDTWRFVFVLTPVSGAPLATPWDLSEIDKQYRDSRRVVVSFWGLREGFGFYVDEFGPEAGPPARALCH
jgi:hypothetical protein